MEPTPGDPKSSGSLVSSVERKESPLNPYNRSCCPKMNVKCPATDTDDIVVGAVNSLAHLKCGAFPESYTDTCSCCPGESSNTDPATDVDPHAAVTRPKDEGCCKSRWLKKVFYRRVKAKVEKAVKKHKIFLIRGELPKLKEALEKRGWLQKYESTKTRTLPYGSVASLEARSLGDIHQPDGTLNEKALIFALLRHTPADFIWDCRNDFVEWHGNVSSNTLLNRHQKSSVYTSKLGMARLLEASHWLHEAGVSSVLFPRGYNVSREPDAFLQDFRLTAAAGLLKWFVKRTQAAKDAKDADDSQDDRRRRRRPIPLSRLEFAVRRCEEFVAVAKHRDIDEDDLVVETIGDEDWSLFLDDYVDAVHNGAGVESPQDVGQERLQSCFLAATAALRKLKAVDPQYELNGTRNVWIVKPSDLCCGAGISISHRLEDVFRRFDGKPKDYFIVQKYIERPLLVRETKFDIRQWYLVTCVFPLTIWMFKQSGHEGEPYRDKIQPKMSEAIVLTMLASQDHMDSRRCSFELYGADFMVTEDLSVWLIEINANPRMHPPSSMTSKRLYGSVQEGLVKVIMDLPTDSSADTGGFRLAYRQNIPEPRPYLGPCFFVFGKSMTLYEHPRKREKERKANIWSAWGKQRRVWTAPPMMPRLRDPTVVDFIDCLNGAAD